MSRSKLSWLFIGCLAGFLKVAAQDIHFSQFYDSPLNLNPALTASENDLRALMIYRDQWRTSGSAFKTFQFTGESRFIYNYRPDAKQKMTFGEKLLYNGGAGLNFYRDRAGDLGLGVVKSEVSLASGVKIGRGKYLRLGLMGGFGQRVIDIGKIRSESAYLGNGSPGSFIVGPLRSFIDIGSGISMHFKEEGRGVISNPSGGDFGVAVYHIIEPRAGFGGNKFMTRRYVGHFRLQKKIPGYETFFIPMVMYVRQGGAQEINGGFHLRFHLNDASRYTSKHKEANVSFGLMYRFQDALVLQSNIQRNNFIAGFAYDINISKLSPATRTVGGFELYLRFILPFRK